MAETETGYQLPPGTRMKTAAERARARRSPEPTLGRGNSSGSDSATTGSADGGAVSLPRPSGNRTVLLAMLVSFGTFALAGPAGASKLGKLQQYLGTTSAGPAPTAETIAPTEGGNSVAVGSVFTVKAIFGWMAIFVILSVLADFDATSQLAGSFAMLIMLSTLLVLGPDALNTVTHLTS
jgi:hypothetical protein